jgi:hypothetical protein
VAIALKSGNFNLLEPSRPVLYLCNLWGFQSGEANAVLLGCDTESIPEERDPTDTYRYCVTAGSIFVTAFDNVACTL